MKTNWGTGTDMTGRAKSTTIALMLCSLALPAWGQQYYLYESKPVGAEQKDQTKGGVLVTEVPVQKGDTLYDISRKFSGHGMYYPQILLFNNIKNPSLIYPGNTLKVPVTNGEAQKASVQTKESTVKTKKSSSKGEKASVPKAATKTVSDQQPVASTPGVAPGTEISLSDLKALDDKKQKKRTETKKVAVKTKANEIQKVRNEKPVVGSKKVEVVEHPAVSTTSGQKLFEKAVKAYRQDDCRNALELFDRYLADNSGSPLAADASLYKAECYLKLSSQ
jgi:hypothetical protein